MNTQRIIVLGFALVAAGGAAFLLLLSALGIYIARRLVRMSYPVVKARRFAK